MRQDVCEGACKTTHPSPNKYVRSDPDGSTPMNMTDASSHPGSTGNVIAAICSFFIPGLGQLVQGRFLAAAFFCVFTLGCYLVANLGWILIVPFIFYVPALILHLMSIISAATWRAK